MTESQVYIMVDKDSFQHKNSSEYTEGKDASVAQRSQRSHTDYNFELVDKSVLEILMGLNKDWSIKRIGENGDTWAFDCPGCSDNNGGNVISGSIGAIRGHALNHEIIEIQDELERLNDLNLKSLLEELKMCSKSNCRYFKIM